MKFTGERMIPEFNNGEEIYLEHITRYSFASQFVKSKTILDIACGSGYGSEKLSKSGAKKVIGVDISEEAVDYCKGKYNSKEIEFKVGTVSNIPVKDCSVDVIVSFETIEHVDHVEQLKFLDEAKRVMKPGGIFIVSTPNSRVYYKGNPFHKKEMDPDDFRRVLESKFKHVEMFYQDDIESSYVYAYESKGMMSVSDSKIGIISEESSMYLIAVCADQKLSNISNHVELSEIKPREILKDNGRIIGSLEDSVRSKDRTINDLQAVLISKNEEIKQKENLIQEKDRKIDSIVADSIELRTRINELSEIKRSKGWRMVLLTRIMINRMLPKGSTRRKVVVFGFKYSVKGARAVFSNVRHIPGAAKSLKKNAYDLVDRTVRKVTGITKNVTGVNRRNAIRNYEEIRPFKSVYYISNVTTGGSRKYLNDLVETFESPCINFVEIKDKSDLDSWKHLFKKDDVLLFQYLFLSDLSFKDIIDVKKEYGIKLVIPVHDFYFLGKSGADFHRCDVGVHFNYLKAFRLDPVVTELLSVADLIIYPSDFVKKTFDAIHVFNNAKVSKHIDYKITDSSRIPKVNKVVNIGIINDIYEHKGAKFYPELFRMSEYDGYEIIYHIFGHVNVPARSTVFHGPYVEGEIFSLLRKHRIHGLVFLNECAETYSYSLTKGINSGLPILYSNMGSYIERLKGISKYFPVNDIKNVRPDMKQMLDRILLDQANISDDKRVSLEKDIPYFYRNLFSVNYEAVLVNKHNENATSYNALFEVVEPYAIYLPQFHALKENSKTFYDGYHDMVNLKQAKRADSHLETPLKDLLGYYNLKEDEGIINKQISLAKAYGFKGFGIYYYWFSRNTVTGNNMIMRDVVDKFFKEEIEDFDVFFIYANESWSGNPAFNQHSNDYLIDNEYSAKKITDNFNNLLPYFKHSNYRKIENKPVLFLHHPWEMSTEELHLFSTIGDEMMKKNGFAGLELVINAMHRGDGPYKYYSHHADYKNAASFTAIENGVRYIDYQKYVDEHVVSMPFRSKHLQTVFYNFDNSVRYFNHKNKKALVTKTKNNSIEYFKKFLTLQLNTYKSHDKAGKIFLVNSWNEWGEQMAIEPSNESGFKLLYAFNDVILGFVERNIPQNFRTTSSQFMMGDKFGEKDISVIIHLYHTDMWDEIKAKLDNIPYKYTLIVSLTEGNYKNEDVDSIKAFDKNVKILVLENRGMDILPFLKCLKLVPETTKFVLKLHSKKSSYQFEVGEKWFHDLIDHVLHDAKSVAEILETLGRTKAGMIGGSTVPGFEYSGIFGSSEFYEPSIESIYQYYGANHTIYNWISGSMFWVRFDIINVFDDEFIDFMEKNQPTGYRKCGTLAHGLERYFGKLVYDAGKVISSVPIEISN